ncbi:MAG: hypothetical protein AAF478_10275 [Pseudomonadota bacterium]
MARIPSPPDLGQNQSFLGWLFERTLRIIIGTWLIWQIIGFAFWSIWQLSGHGFREFMFRDFIDLWDNHSWRLPEWVGYIPTWQTPWVWVALVLFIVWWNWPRIKNRSRSTPTFADPPRYRGSAKSQSDPHEDWRDESEFAYQSSKWKRKSKSRDLAGGETLADQYKDALDLFELSEPFTVAELKASYSKLAKETHPDNGGNPALFRQVSKFYELLKTRAK